MAKKYYIRVKNIKPYGGFQKGQLTTFASDGKNKQEAVKNFREYYSSEDWELLAVKKHREPLYKGEPYRVQVLPAHDDTQVTECPWCGEEHEMEGTEIDDYYDVIDYDKGFYRHKKCGKIVRIRSWEEVNLGVRNDD